MRYARSDGNAVSGAELAAHAHDDDPAVVPRTVNRVIALTHRTQLPARPPTSRYVQPCRDVGGILGPFVRAPPLQQVTNNASLTCVRPATLADHLVRSFIGARTR